MKSSRKFFFFVIFLSLKKFSETNSSSTEITSTTIKSHEPHNKIDLFYNAVSDSLKATPALKMYSRRVDCIVKYMKSEKAILFVDKNLYEFKLNNSKFKVVFINESIVLSRLEPQIDKGNFDCTIAGFIGVILISIILLIVVSCVACISKM